MAELHSAGQLEELCQKTAKKDQGKVIISISSGTCGQARGSQKVVAAFKEAIEPMADRISLKVTGCHGFCEAEPNVLVFPQEFFYKNLQPEHAKRIVEAALKGEIVADLAYRENGTIYTRLTEIPFYKKQKRILLGDNVLIDPTNIEDYIALRGYQSLAKALKMRAEEIIEEIKRSALRGRGGAGFPTGKKWEMTRAQKGDTKYIICNADEGDPGAYMDRSLLEGNPHLILEGLIIGAYAIGAKEGWIYVRNEYPLAVKNVTLAIKQAENYGLLGENILGSDFSFTIKIVKGAGAFVCGEETALIQSIESLRGVPKQRPPFPVEKGLFGNPTNINNVETLANIPKIIDQGATWYNTIGTPTSKGTKIFSLVGKVKNTGLVEVPMGITLQEIVYEIGGGSPNGKKIKAVQTGGPSGGCIPEEQFGLPIDYESLKEAGSIMGSGGMIVMDENTCMVDVAKYFTNFLQEESCGKCVPCREGTQRMFEILANISAGQGQDEELITLEQLGKVIKETSLCGLGQTAPNPLLSTLRYFKDEYEAHIKNKKCPAGVCKALIKYSITAENCTGCGVCKNNCPEKAISGTLKSPHSIDLAKCSKCGICREVCKFKAIMIA